VICVQCKTILAYDAQKAGSKTLKLHYENCKMKPVVAPKMTSFFESEKDDKVSTEQKKKMLDTCVKFCAYDMRPFNLINGCGFEALGQALLVIGHSNSSRHSIKISGFLPDPTTISEIMTNLKLLPLFTKSLIDNI